MIIIRWIIIKGSNNIMIIINTLEELQNGSVWTHNCLYNFLLHSTINSLLFVHKCFEWFLECLILRVYTDFESKIQDYFQIFLQNNNFVFQTRGCQIGDQFRP